ncbi:hypothetical protein H4R18_000342 [Coemansia javaensis]|uniref:Uncharacterized protein n=1 Tax=Coemansia javaensis TaxID=2761396 RepID=A0A9W8HGJ7_9FUNG|nr:hypothetical protein H4R18_000342 [Coemansia javaensis]
MYPPPQPSYPPELVEQTRQASIRSVKRRGIFYGGLEVLFTAIFAALLVVYIRRAQDDNNSNIDSRYNSGWFRWYIGLLIGLLVLNALFAAYTIWQTMRAIAWLKDPNTPPELIMAGRYPYSSYGFGRVIVVEQRPAYPPQQGYYQGQPPPPPPPPPQQGYYQSHSQQHPAYPPPPGHNPPMYATDGANGNGDSYYDGNRKN